MYQARKHVDLNTNFEPQEFLFQTDQQNIFKSVTKI